MMSGQSEQIFDASELDRLKSSNLLKDFVNVQDGYWDHVQWEDFLSTINDLGYSLPVEVIGTELEIEKEYYWKVKRGEITVLDESAPVLEDDVTEEITTQKHAPFDPIKELENAIIVEDDVLQNGDTENSWENVDFDSLSREERRVYLKDNMKKKLGEG
ncbi:MAG: hypothetical protein ABIG39_06395 [Candidatus Micrarchaeota archaeon]